MANTKSRIKQRRLERMRLGQAACSFVPLVSDPEIRIAIVPLTEAEFEQCLEIVAMMEAQDNIAGFGLRDRRQAQEILVRAIREEDDLTQRVYDTIEEMMEDLESVDIDQLIDEYNEMTEQSNPKLDGIPEEEFDRLKKVLQEMDWNVLSGSAWYAAKRFLGKLPPELLLANGRGSISTNSSTTTNE